MGVKKPVDLMSMTTKVSAAVIAAAAIIVMCWQLLAEPCIQKQIDRTTEPIIDVLEYQTFLMMQTLTDEQIKKADDGYVAGKKMRVRRSN